MERAHQNQATANEVKELLESYGTLPASHNGVDLSRISALDNV